MHDSIQRGRGGEGIHAATPMGRGVRQTYLFSGGGQNRDLPSYIPELDPPPKGMPNMCPATLGLLFL